MPTLEWLTREEDLKRASRVPYRLLEADPTMSYGDPASGNMLIQGDNLDALKTLLPYYTGQVKCIYIDPPYNTKMAVSEHYDDNLEHTQWLAIIYVRLRLIVDLLAPDGLLAIQIDDREFAHLYLILTEFFSHDELKVIVVKMSEPSGLKMASVRRAGSVPKLKEYVILAKRGGVKGLQIERIRKGAWDREYNIYLEGITRAERDEIAELASLDDITDEVIKRLDEICSKIELKPLSVLEKSQNLDEDSLDEWRFTNAWRICQCATSSSVRKLAEEKRKFNTNEVFFVRSIRGLAYMVRSSFSSESAKPRVQLIFADDNLEVHPGDLWTDIKTTGLDGEGGVDFKNGKKPEALIYRVLKMATSPGDLVLDSFLGSGTTAAVAQKMGRQWIGVEMGEQALTHCIPRLKKVIEGEQGGISQTVGWSGGGGFTFYKLGDEVFDADGHIRIGITFESLAAHVWFSETGVPRPAAGGPFLGAYDGTGYALLYNGVLGDRRPEGGNVLTSATLSQIRQDGEGFEGPLIIYGTASRLSGARLKAEAVTFKQTPYDVKAR